MKKLWVKLALCATIFVSGIALAGGEAGSGPNPYRDCGVGAAMFGDTAWAAATSNVIWDLGTTAVTSATASPQTCSKQNVKAAMLIRDSYAQISEDTARGQGEHLAAALEVFGCGTAQQPAAANTVRAEFGKAVGSQNYGGQSQIEKAGQMFNIIESAANNHCGV